MLSSEPRTQRSGVSGRQPLKTFDHLCVDILDRLEQFPIAAKMEAAEEDL
jgi:hypothetical protein